MLQLFENLMIGNNPKHGFNKILELAVSQEYDRFNIFSEAQLDAFISNLSDNRDILDDDFLDMWDTFFLNYGINDLEFGNFQKGNIFFEKGETLNIYVKDKLICIQSDLNKNIYLVLVKFNITKELGKALKQAEKCAREF